MKRGFIPLLLCVLIVSVLAIHFFVIGIEGNGKKIVNSVKLSGPWSSLEISNIAANVHLSNEQSDLVKYAIDDNLEKYLAITENNGVLVIKTTSDRPISSKNGQDIDFYIGTGKLTKLKLTNEIKLEGMGEFAADDFTLETTGAAVAALNVNCNHTKINSTGESEINLQGKSETIDAQLTGHSKLLAKDFQTTDATIDLHGSAAVEIYAQKNLRVTGAGEVNVTYWGEPQLSQEIFGSGVVKRGNP